MNLTQIFAIDFLPTFLFALYQGTYGKKKINTATAMGLLWPAFFVVWFVRGVIDAGFEVWKAATEA